MPEGFEHSLDAASMADLFAFVTAKAAVPKSFVGNRAEVIRPDPNGILKLSASRAEIYGDSLVFEPGHGNLGFWQSNSDRAIWSLELAKAGTYEVWLDWASPGPAGNPRLRFEANGTVLEHAVAATGSWDAYRQVRAGTLHLPKGKLRFVVRGVPPVREAMLDLREIRLVPPGSPSPGEFPAAGPAK